MDQETQEILASPYLTTDDFKPIRIVGNGDMGTVFMAVLRATNQVFAVKVMNKEILKARENVHRAEREREILSMLSYPFLPSLLAHFESEQNVFLVMNYCSGGDLSVLKQKQVHNKFLASTARFYAAEVLLALEHLHKLGIAYRDLKPENVLIQQDGHVMLTDFDLSVILRDSSVIPAHNLFFQVGVKLRKLKKRMSQYLLFACTTSRQHVLKPGHVKRSFRMNLVSRVFPLELYRRKSRKRNRSVVRSYSFVGTEEYVAPEILLGTGHGIPVDWWTFGVFLYEMVYGTTPFRGRNRKETFHNILSKEPEVPQQTSSLSDLILKLLVKQSDNRLGSKFGATEIKEHPFFHGIQWNALQHISRPPYVPGPFCLGKYEKDYTDLLVKSDFATLFSDCQVADSTHELRNTQAKRSCTPSEVSSEDLFPPFTNVMQTVRSIHSNGSWSSIDSKVESDIPGQQLNNVVDLGLNDVLHPTKNMMSSERFLVDEPVISFCQPEEPISRCIHPLRTCERASIYKIDLCLQSCGSCFAKDAIDWQEKSKEDSRSRLSSFACHTLSTRKHEILSKISSDSIQSNGKLCTTEVVPGVFPSFIDIEDQEDEFFDLELAMEQLAKDNVNLQESEQEDADHLFEVLF